MLFTYQCDIIWQLLVIFDNVIIASLQSDVFTWHPESHMLKNMQQWSVLKWFYQIMYVLFPLNVYLHAQFFYKQVGVNPTRDFYE
jgi:hypothetical protein